MFLNSTVVDSARGYSQYIVRCARTGEGLLFWNLFRQQSKKLDSWVCKGCGAHSNFENSDKNFRRLNALHLVMLCVKFWRQQWPIELLRFAKTHNFTTCIFAGYSQIPGEIPFQIKLCESRNSMDDEINSRCCHVCGVFSCSPRYILCININVYL